MFAVSFRNSLAACWLALFASALVGAQPPRHATGSVEGVLTYPNGQPANGFAIEVIGTSPTSEGGRSVFTDDHGKFTASDLPFGSYALAPRLDSIDSRYPPADGAFFNDHLVRFTISPNHPVTTTNVQLDPPCLIISGDATDAVSGKPLVVAIIMRQKTDPENKWVKFGSAPSGKYHMWLPPGEAIMLKASAQGYRDFETTIPAITDGKDPVVDIVMVPQKNPTGH